MENQEESTTMIQLTKSELEVLLFIIDDWRTTKSEERLSVKYPNSSTTSSTLIRVLHDIYKHLI